MDESREGRALRPAHPAERAVGIGVYASDADGVGGRLRDRPEDFRVTELEDFETVPVDADPGAYPALVVRATLRDRDTNGFARDLADRLGISRERITWAGTKDKRAVTTQLIAVTGWTDDPDLPDVPGADLEVVGRAGRPVLFGDLTGNRFEVVLREPAAPGRAPEITRQLRGFARDAFLDGGETGETDDAGDAGATDGGGDDRADGETVDDADDADAPVGVPNFFGQQRFGSLRPITHEAGLGVVRGDWEGAVMTYLADASEAEPDDTRAAREYVAETRDWQGALDRFPTRLTYERAMLHRLAEADADDPGPAAFRAALETLPTNVQTLLVNAAQSYLFNRTLTRRLEAGLPVARPVVGDVVCFAGDDGFPDADRTQRVTERRLRTVERHCERGRAFVTLPLVGTDTELGEGEPGELERAVLEEAGLAPADFDLPGEFGSTGTRRAALVRTDLSVEAGAPDEDDADALTFRFDLPKGAYATVVLREYLKGDPAAMR